MNLNVNTSELIRYTNDLEKLRRSALPNAVRNTLNTLAFETKTKNLNKTTDKIFKKREPNFFKANSSFENAKGFDINSMNSKIGMRLNKPKVSNDQSVNDLLQQETGGQIDNRDFVATNEARVGSKGRVKTKYRLSKIGKIAQQKDIANRPKSIAFANAIRKNKGGFFIGGQFDKEAVFSVNSIGKATKIYNFRKNRNVKVKSTNFLQKSSLVVMSRINDIFVKCALREINK